MTAGDFLENPEIGGRIMINWILQKCGGVVLTSLILIRGGILRSEFLDSIQGLHCYIEFVTWLLASCS